MATFLAFRYAAATILRPRHHVAPLAGLLCMQTRHVSAKYERRYLRNDKIPHKTVQLINGEGKLDPPTALTSILASIDHETAFVELITGEPSPIVRIVDKVERAKMLKEIKQRRKEVTKRAVHKEIQLTWGMAAADLAHKMRKVRTELEKGGRVDLVWAPKTGQAPPARPDMQARLTEIAESLEDVGKECKNRELHKATAILYLQSLERT